MASKTDNGEKKRKGKRRGHGEGTITKRPDGRIMAQIPIGYDGDGKLKRMTKYFQKGQDREARDWLAEVRTEINKGNFVAPDKATVAEWVDKWLTTYARPKVAVTSYDYYDVLVRCHIIPSIGMIELQKLRPMDVQKMYAEKMANGRQDGKPLSVETIRCIHGILHSCLKQAVREGLVQRNVIDATEPPKPVRADIKPLDREAVERFLETARMDRLGALFVMAIGTGMRKGELLALRWQDVDLGKATAAVKRTLARVKNKDGKGSKTGLIFKESKRGKFRTVALAGFVVRALKEHHRR